jgi:hypothetical protein
MMVSLLRLAVGVAGVKNDDDDEDESAAALVVREWCRVNRYNWRRRQPSTMMDAMATARLCIFMSGEW